MSGIIETFLKCDGPLDADHGCQDSCGVDSRGVFTRGPSIAEHRFDARDMGWRQVGSKDYCPACLRALNLPAARPSRRPRPAHFLPITGDTPS